MSETGGMPRCLVCGTPGAELPMDCQGECAEDRRIEQRLEDLVEAAASAGYDPWDYK